MSAHEIVTAAVQASRDTRANRSSARIAGAVLEALRRAGYAVIEVVPLSELRHGFALEVRRGRILDHGPLDGYTPEDARQFAAALLAAADAAEHPGTPVEASQP